jgi:hypothetical protein
MPSIRTTLFTDKNKAQKFRRLDWSGGGGGGGGGNSHINNKRANKGRLSKWLAVSLFCQAEKGTQTDLVKRMEKFTLNQST